MKGTNIVKSVFTYIDDLMDAVKAIKEKGLDFTVYSPTYVEEVVEACDDKRSPVAIITFIGAASGLIFGFSLAILTSMDWPLRVGAKEIAAIPSFVVVGYECTILFGAIFTLNAILFFCKLPDLFRRPGYDPRFSDDKFGLIVGVENSNSEQVMELLKSFKPDEVEIKNGL